ncbi:MAG: ribonuclease J [Desulfobacterales bacterium]|nr:ribonuclease J [Desulfobacterales bacterium]
MMVIEYDEYIFIIDAGIMFPEDYMLGVDIVIPLMDYIKQKKNNILGLVLTHAHEDHIGAVPYLLKIVNVPIYATSFTLGMLKAKLEECTLLSAITFNEISPEKKLEIGPFELDFIRVNHSVIDGVAVAIRTPLGVIIHTGDFKINLSANDGSITDINKFALYGQKGVLALLSDSTNVEREGFTLSDQQIGDSIEKIFSRSNGRIIIALFASNIARIQQVINICESRGRKVFINGRSIETSSNIAKSLGYLKIPDGMLLDITKLSDIPDSKITIVITGSQGEPMSALARISSGTHKYIKVKQEDTIILSSKFIPGNEKAIYHIINSLYRKGADVIYEMISDIHVSGHAFQEELKLMIKLTKPKYFIPIHGEYRHLVLHTRIAAQIGLPQENILLAENGRVISFNHNGASINESVISGRVLVDGKGVGDVGRSVLKERRALSEDGLVAVTLGIDEATGIIIYGPKLLSKGFIFENETGHLLEDAKCVILEIVEDSLPIDKPEKLNKIRSEVQSNLRQYFKIAIKRRPVIMPFIFTI